MAWNVHMPDAEWFTPCAEIESVVREVDATKIIAVDTETTGLNYMRDIPLYWSMAWERPNGQIRRLCLRADTLPYFKHCFAAADKEWVFANAKYDIHMLKNVGISIAGLVCDTPVMHSLLYEEESHALAHMGRQVLGWEWKDDFKEGFKKEGPFAFLTRLEQQDLPRLVEYASNDAYGTLMIRKELYRQLANAPTWSAFPDLFPTLLELFYKVEAPFTKVLWKCERAGVYIDAPYLKAIEGPVTQELQKIEREINRIVGWPLNTNSGPQLRKYFFEEKGYSPLKMTKGGKKGTREASVDAETLEYLASKYQDPVAKLMVSFRDLDKLKGTYVEGIQADLDPFGRVHTRFNQDVARTGRLSSANINLQNIPRPDGDKFKIRRAFIAEPGNDMIVADYEALEMRILAAASGERDMVQIFLDNKDIHMGNASLVFGLPYDDIKAAKKIDKEVKEGKRPESDMTDYMTKCLNSRQQVKEIGFGLNYGMKENNLAHRLGCTKEQALELMDKYMSRYPAVRKFYDESINQVKQCGYAFTLLGRRRFLPEITSSQNDVRWRAERQASNVPIQGTAADVVKMAMIKCDEEDIHGEFGYHMLIQVHDELMFEGPEETVEPAKKRIKEIMEDSLPIRLQVPLTVSIGSGKNWLDSK